MDDIQDIKPIVDISITNYIVVGIILFFLIFFIVIYIVIYIYKSKKLNTVSEELFTSYKKTMDSLNNINKDDYIFFYNRLSEILKIYLGDIFNFTAFSLTTDEINQKLLEKNLPEDIIKDIRKILLNSDLVKFALSKHSKSKMEKDLKKVKEVIEKVKNLRLH